MNEINDTIYKKIIEYFYYSIRYVLWQPIQNGLLLQV
jgi:hypothetical protein